MKFHCLAPPLLPTVFQLWGQEVNTTESISRPGLSLCLNRVCVCVCPDGGRMFGSWSRFRLRIEVGGGSGSQRGRQNSGPALCCVQDPERVVRGRSGWSERRESESPKDAERHTGLKGNWPHFLETSQINPLLLVCNQFDCRFWSHEKPIDECVFFSN